MPRAETRIKKQLTDATIVSQDDVRQLDTVGTETVERFATVRSQRFAMRRLLFDAGSGGLAVHTLAGRMLNAATGSGSATAWVAALNAVVTGAGDNSQFKPGDAGSPVPDAAIPSKDLRVLLSRVTVLLDDGNFYIDDLGTTTLFRPGDALSTKHALRRVISTTGGGVFRLNTLSGKAILDIAALGGGAVIGDLNAAVTDITSAVTTAASTQNDLTAPSASARQIFQSVLRQRGGTDNRNVVIDNVGAPTNTVTAGLRYSHRKMLFDLLDTEGERVFTTAGDGLAAASVLGATTVAAVVSAIQGAVA